MRAYCGCCEKYTHVLANELSPNGLACVDCATIVAEAQETDTIGTIAPEA